MKVSRSNYGKCTCVIGYVLRMRSNCAANSCFTNNNKIVKISQILLYVSDLLNSRIHHNLVFGYLRDFLIIIKLIGL